ncbi:hypothetical protein BX600DRAFT_380432 [Xylariales sp. PMI_506]|nr:hypothetical protein BX600DRAFT_380432 [Xylariales sp. PMI_506]
MGKDTNLILPKNWPTALTYLTQPFFAPHVTKEQLQVVKSRPADLSAEIASNFPRGPSSLVKITLIVSSTHPANGQAGLFAVRALEPGALILPYYGIVHSSVPPHSTAHDKSDYDLWLDRGVGLAIDAAEAGNEARFVNDYRGVRERPNAEFKECWDSRTGTRCMAVFVLPAGKKAGKKSSHRGIGKGEEICVSYGKGFWGKRQEEEEKESS